MVRSLHVLLVNQGLNPGLDGKGAGMEPLAHQRDQLGHQPAVLHLLPALHDPYDVRLQLPLPVHLDLLHRLHVVRTAFPSFADPLLDLHTTVRGGERVVNRKYILTLDFTGLWTFDEDLLRCIRKK